MSTPQPLEMLAEYDDDKELAATKAEIRAVSCGKESIRLQDLRKQAEEDHIFKLVFQIAEAIYLISASHSGELEANYP